MGKVTIEMIAGFYEYGKKFYHNQISHKEGKEQLILLGMNPNSAADSLYIYGNFVEGKLVKRTTSVLAIDYILNRIHNELGVPGLRKATSSLTKHIEYYTEVRKINVVSKQNILNKYLTILDKSSPYITLPDEQDKSSNLTEGKSISVLVNKYERNNEAREKCLAHYGYTCSVCSFNFNNTYGSIGNEFIHVHHLKELSSIGHAYIIDPIKDLIPVCPNCHAMLHKKTPAYTIIELKAIISNLL